MPAAAPAVTSINPTSGSSNGGTEVTVYGTDFVEGDGVPAIGRMSEKATEEDLPPGSGTIRNLYRDAARRDLQFTWGHVHLKEKYIFVSDMITKNHQSRNVPMNATVENILRRRNVTELGDHVFGNAAGTKLTVLTNAFWKAVDEAHLYRRETVDGKMVKTRFRFHDCRHTFGARLGMNGTDLKSIMEIMGHKTAKAAMRYQHPSPSHKLEAVKSLDKTWGTSSSKIMKLNKIL